MINKHIPLSCCSPQKTQSLVFIYSFKPNLQFAKQNFLLLCLLSNFVKMESYWIPSSVIFSSTPSQTSAFEIRLCGHTQQKFIGLHCCIVLHYLHMTMYIVQWMPITQYTVPITQRICVLLWMDPCAFSRFLWLLFFCCEQCFFEYSCRNCWYTDVLLLDKPSRELPR